MQQTCPCINPSHFGKESSNFKSVKSASVILRSLVGNLYQELIYDIRLSKYAEYSGGDYFKSG